ncbi:aromatic acid exporter family protein [Brevibacillus fluminis]|uniref:aromatic acid exporter family protein n=1 Tax=Brevibacillus fluminis TaxID=511487 RepID=UPI003F8C254C
MLIGARVIKTSLAVLLSILIARSVELHTPHFAGMIAVLSVQPSSGDRACSGGSACRDMAKTQSAGPCPIVGQQL